MLVQPLHLRSSSQGHRLGGAAAEGVQPSERVGRWGCAMPRPKTGLCGTSRNSESNLSTENNLVIRTVHGSGVLKEDREPDPAKRYKILTSCGRKGLGVSFSPDGVRWEPPTLCPTINPYRVDGTHYNVLWVEELGEYAGSHGCATRATMVPRK